MKVTGVIAEYNPFHNGHKYMLEQCAANGATHIVAVMSGNFVQRGSVAIMDKRARAAAALSSGVDLVVELPVPWAVATAETFARGGVSVLRALGCVDALSFGAECADVDLLRKAADAVRDVKVNELIRRELEGGISYPKARENAVSSIYGEDVAEVIKHPNNILAVEYIKALYSCVSSDALDSLGTHMAIEPIRRKGAEHDSLKENGEFASASALRVLLERGDTDAFQYMPKASCEQYEKLKAVGRAPACIDESERAILSHLRGLTAEDIKTAPDVTEGLENRIYNAIQSATSLQELYDSIKTKRYTHSRIRRIISALYLGISPDDAVGDVSYIRVLGFNDRGMEILKTAKSTAKLPVIMKTANFEKLDGRAKHIFELECKATNLYNLTTPRILPCGTECSDELVIL